MFLATLFLFFALLIAFQISTIPYTNPYRLVLIIGKKGSGKTTTLVKLAHKAQRRGRPVYSNVPLPGAHLLNDKDIGFFQIPAGSVVVLDEVGMIWDNRDFKNFRTEVRDWFKLQRHYRITVYLCSQTPDIDKKLRDLCDEIWVVENKFKIFAYGKRVLKKITLTEARGDEPSCIAENLKFDSILFFWCGSRMLTCIPRWAASFDSFVAPQLRRKNWQVDDRQFEPVPYRLVFFDLLRNFFAVVGADRLVSRVQQLRGRFIQLRHRAQQVEDLPPDMVADMDFTEFFSRPVDRE